MLKIGLLTSCAYSNDRAGRAVLREVQVTTVGREHRLAQLLLEFLAGTLDELHAVAAVDAVEPDFSRAERTARREMLAGRDDNARPGCQTALFSRRKSSLVTWRGALPSAFMIQTLSPPVRSEVKTICVPSGE